MDKPVQAHRNKKYREMGTGIYLDMARYIASRCPVTSEQTEEHTKEAAELYLLPQFQGLSRNTSEKIAGVIQGALPAYSFDQDKMEINNLIILK